MANSLKDYKWQYRYCSSSLNANGEPTDILHDFYLPALKRIVSYDRVAGFFRSTSLAAASQGYTAFLKHGGNMRMIVGADLQLQDVAAILAGNHQRLSDPLMKELAEPESWPEEVQNGVALLGAMVAAGQLEIRVALRVNSKTGQPISADSVEDGYVHEKWFVMKDEEGNRIYGAGSLNESRTALTLNAENIDIHCDWKSEEASQRTDGAEQDFRLLWENRNPHIRVLSIPDAVRERLIRLKDLREQPTEIDGTIVMDRFAPTPEEILQFCVLKDAPRMPGGEFIGMYSALVEPWPHQEIVSRRLVESWPYSYLMCDEVGLGKTIEAALAIRSLYLSGRAKRVMVVAPASLTNQWHRELAQKAMLPFSLTKPKPGGTGKISHKRIYPTEEEQFDENLYSPELNIISTGIVSRRERAEQLQKSERCDIILVDEAHYARRQNPRDSSAGNPRYGNLYTTVQNNLKELGQSLWMATATPMQIDPIEVYDLFRLTERTGQFSADPSLSMVYFDLLGKIVRNSQLTMQEWEMLGQSFRQIEALDPYLWNVLQTTVINGKNRKVLANLITKEPMRADIRHLKQPLFAASPLSRVMMRHTRSLLEIYKQNGKLNSNLAKRNIRPICAVKFTPAEADFYKQLEGYDAELNRQIKKYNAQAKQVMAFLLNFLQLRFASSQYAIQKTLERRLRRVEYTLLVGARNFDSEEELKEVLNSLEETSDEYDEGDLDDITLDALLKDRSKQDLEWEQQKLKEMLESLSHISETPSKIQALLQELDRRKQGNRLRQTVLFTRFYDSLFSIREHLKVKAPTMRIGVYSGGHAFWYNPLTGEDEAATREEIKSIFLRGDIDLLLCTDAAAEGLNLQTADLLINFDLGWNPMKIEQRIGRIDRIGQKHDSIDVLNMCYLGSAEETVYGRLLERLRQADIVVGAQQISMLPVNTEQFRQLHDNKITLEDLTRASMDELQRQKKATASMEMSAEDVYTMYMRMSEQHHQQELPADLDSLWTALTSSPCLKSLGAKIDSNGYWHIPTIDGSPSFTGTIDRNTVGDSTEFITWGNQTVDAILRMFSDCLPDAAYLRRIESEAEGAVVVGYAASTDTGPVLVTSIKGTASIRLCPEKPLADTDVRICQNQLDQIAGSIGAALKSARQAEKKNQDFAALHGEYIRCCAISILEKTLQNGCTKYIDAVKELENTNEVYTVKLPTQVFSGKSNTMLFQCAEHGGTVYTTVSGDLLHCVIEAIERTAAEIKSSKQDKAERTTVEVIRRLERRKENAKA